MESQNFNPSLGLDFLLMMEEPANRWSASSEHNGTK